MSASGERAKAKRAAEKLSRYLGGCLYCEPWTWRPDHIEKLAARIVKSLRAYSSDAVTVGRHKAAVRRRHGS